MRATKHLQLGEHLSLPIEAVSARTAVLGQPGTGKTSTAVVFVEEAAKAGAQFVVIDPTGAWYGLRSSADGKGPGVDCVVLGGAHGDAPLDEHAGRVVARLVAKQGYRLVLDLDGLKSWGARQRFVADFCAELYEVCDSQVLMVMDEAHRFAPQGRMDESGHAARCFGAVSDVVLLGRRRGLSSLVISQRAAKLHKDILEASEVLIAHRLRGNNDQTALKGWIDTTDLDVRTVLTEIKGLPNGRARVSAPTFDIDGTYMVRRKGTFDSSKTLGLGERAVEPVGRADVDMAQLGQLMAESIAQAKATDPKALQARVRELERQLDDRVKVESVTIETKVPVVPDDVVEAVLALDSIEGVVASLTEQLGIVSRQARAAITAVRAVPRSDGPGQVRTGPARTGQVVPGPARAREAPAREVSGPPDGSLGRAERAILTVLAQFPDGRTVRQVAMLTGYSAKGGGFRNALSSLRTAGRIGRGDPIVIHPVGLDAIGDFEPLPTGQALFAHWLSQVDRAGREVLTVLADVFPGSLSAQEIAARSMSDSGEPYSAAGGGFRNSLSRLRTLQLIEGRGEMRLSSELAEAIR